MKPLAPRWNHSKPLDAVWLWQHVSPCPNTGCWWWTAALSETGYGNASVAGRFIPAHRVVYQLVRGEIPRGLHLDHLCRNRGCVNPFHLEPVSVGENSRRGDTGSYLAKINNAKTQCPRGHPYSGDNLFVTRAGKRLCRTCKRMNERAHYWKNKGATP
jgi:hypothetical protein